MLYHNYKKKLTTLNTTIKNHTKNKKILRKPKELMKVNKKVVIKLKVSKVLIDQEPKEASREEAEVDTEEEVNSAAEENIEVEENTEAEAVNSVEEANIEAEESIEEEVAEVATNKEKILMMMDSKLSRKDKINQREAEVVAVEAAEVEEAEMLQAKINNNNKINNKFKNDDYSPSNMN